MEISIKNFNVNVFKHLISQSLIVSKELTFEWSKDQIKSCSTTKSNSFMKLWVAQLKDLIETKDEIELFENVIEENDFPTFNMYVIKGDLFNKFLSVNTSETVDLLFTLTEDKGKYQASSITVIGKSENGNNLITKFTLSTEELLTNKISDYAGVISACTPTNSMFEFVLSKKQIQEIKRLIKTLQFTGGTENTAYITFNVNVDEKKIKVNDKVFEVILNLESDGLKFPENDFSFNILKSDFCTAGNSTFSIYTEENDQKVIFGTKFSKGLIWCLSSKVSESAGLNFDSSILDSTIDSIDFDIDDLPF